MTTLDQGKFRLRPLPECLESVPLGATLSVQVQLTRRWLSREIKSFSLSAVGDCDLSAHDAMAVEQVEFCEDWSRERE